MKKAFPSNLIFLNNLMCFSFYEVKSNKSNKNFVTGNWLLWKYWRFKI